jgi:uncharacterized membrane protein YfcA
MTRAEVWPLFDNMLDAPSALFGAMASIPLIDAAVAVLAVLLGYLILGLTGFGSALVVVPMLTWNWQLSLVVPLVLLIDVPASLLHTGLNLRQVAWREIPRLVPTMVLGAALGAVLLVHADSALPWLLIGLGLYIAVVGLRGLWVAVLPAPVHPHWAWPAGFAMGLVESLFGTVGPVVVAWLSRRLPDPTSLRATLPVTIAVAATLAIGGAALSGQMKQPLLWVAWLLLQPVALAGVVLGHRIAGRLPAGQIRRVVFSLLVLSGVATAVRGALTVLAHAG